ncbi:hypothetical protein FRZ61_37700 [Hypericibacter adhaerens]|jgi:hypothetical protein|uniref:Uncharacterized protein n=1 Tax=Hypericibacter adhaerens TaxID=2602016 RepID=A0A5J6N279_9PROT|nr:hypothetical protein FRZ61_37700 [Hypericibacter adhaerens]
MRTGALMVTLRKFIGTIARSAMKVRESPAEHGVTMGNGLHLASFNDKRRLWRQRADE